MRLISCVVPKKRVYEEPEEEGEEGKDCFEELKEM